MQRRHCLFSGNDREIIMQSVCVPKRSPCDTSKLCVNTLSADRLHGVRKPMVLLGE